jgi:hypothetical protein
VFAAAGSGLADAALECVINTLGSGATVLGALSNCGLAARYPMQVLDNAVEETNTCLDGVLAQLEQRKELCER